MQPVQHTKNLWCPVSSECLKQCSDLKKDIYMVKRQGGLFDKYKVWWNSVHVWKSLISWVGVRVKNYIIDFMIKNYLLTKVCTKSSFFLRRSTIDVYKIFRDIPRLLTCLVYCWLEWNGCRACLENCFWFTSCCSSWISFPSFIIPLVLFSNGANEI
jgi:hypothetical protein